MQLEVKTNIQCDKCISKISHVLNTDSNISKWSVDLEDPDKKLVLHGNNLSFNKISLLLQKTGYEIKPFKSSNDYSSYSNKAKSFWKDLPKWKRASFNTFNCLLGCSIGDFGMIIFLQAYYPQVSVATQMVLAIIAGLCTSIILEAIIMKVRESFSWKEAFQTAFSMSFISMIAMEIAMNTTDFLITGASATFEDPMYWAAFGIAAISGFLAPLPYNYFKIKKYNQACH